MLFFGNWKPCSKLCDPWHNEKHIKQTRPSETSSVRQVVPPKHSFVQQESDTRRLRCSRTRSRPFRKLQYQTLHAEFPKLDQDAAVPVAQSCTRKAIGRQGTGSVCKELPCFSAMPCRPVPLLVYFWFVKPTLLFSTPEASRQFNCICSAIKFHSRDLSPYLSKHETLTTCHS